MSFDHVSGLHCLNGPLDPQLLQAVESLSRAALTAFFSGSGRKRSQVQLRTLLGKKAFDPWLGQPQLELIIGFQPKLICDDTAELLLNCLRSDLVQVLLDLGWRSSPKFVASVEQLIADGLESCPTEERPLQEIHARQVRSSLLALPMVS